ncbi:MAG: 2-C-methyl-D-erythritol 4-phosphate cytidylyltransferase [Candidatus Binatota bacterium]|nr:2-C-methyl-D-erythritol 4-phosphate cytidylyltransferase [Candidatus Binatota bacterium]
MRSAVFVVAAGRGERLGAALPKAFVALRGEPLVSHAVRRLRASGVFDELVVAAPAEEVDRCVELFAAARVVPGGSTRQESVRNALAAIPSAVEVVLVHDAARPLVSAEVVRRVHDAARRHGAAMAAIPVTDTLKAVASDGTITATAHRESLWMAQTPQGFHTELLRQAHDAAARDGVEATDDAALVERLGHPVRVVEGSRTNLKITVPEDLAIAEALLAGGLIGD